MATRFIKSLVLTTVLVTGLSVTTARAAPNDDLFGFLAIAGLLIALSNADNASAETTTDTNAGSYQHISPIKKLPKQCLQTFTTQNGRVRTFEKTCLQENFRYNHRLPKSCKQTIWSSVGLRYGYEPQCLRNNGYVALPRR